MERQNYFDQSELLNTALRWAVATRVQLDRWEPFVAAHVRGGGTSREAWMARNEHHLAIIAATHMIRASDRLLPGIKGTPSLVRQEVLESRDLLEHWFENQPVFNVRPAPNEPPKPSGKRYAERNPNQGPYLSVRWDLQVGPLFTPNVPAFEVRNLVARVEKRAVEEDPALERFLEISPPSPWGWGEGRGWWPRSQALPE